MTDRIPKVGDVFFKNIMAKGRQVQSIRRVIEVHQNWVFYSDGTDKNQACTVDAFQQWMCKAYELDRSLARA